MWYVNDPRFLHLPIRLRIVLAGENVLFNIFRIVPQIKDHNQNGKQAFTEQKPNCNTSWDHEWNGNGNGYAAAYAYKLISHITDISKSKYMNGYD